MLWREAADIQCQQKKERGPKRLKGHLAPNLLSCSLDSPGLKCQLWEEDGGARWEPAIRGFHLPNVPIFKATAKPEGIISLERATEIKDFKGENATYFKVSSRREQRREEE